MSMLTDLRSRLAADSGVSAITTRVAMYVSNQSDALPRITIHQVSGDHEHHMLAATGKAIGRVQINCYASTPVGSETLAEAVRQSLDGFRGLMGSTFVSMCHLEDERSQIDEPKEGRNESGGVYSVQIDYTIGWTVSVPTFS